MRRSAFDERRDAKVADDHLANHAACMACGASAPRSDLSDLGGRCRDCYGRYCAAANPPWYRGQRFSREERIAMAQRMREVVRGMTVEQGDPKAWAKALRDREAGGELLSEVQRRAWRGALGQAVREAGPDEDGIELDRRDGMARRVADYADERGIAL